MKHKNSLHLLKIFQQIILLTWRDDPFQQNICSINRSFLNTFSKGNFTKLPGNLAAFCNSVGFPLSIIPVIPIALLCAYPFFSSWECRVSVAIARKHVLFTANKNNQTMHMSIMFHFKKRCSIVFLFSWLKEYG